MPSVSKGYGTCTTSTTLVVYLVCQAFQREVGYSYSHLTEEGREQGDYCASVPNVRDIQRLNQANGNELEREPVTACTPCRYGTPRPWEQLDGWFYWRWVWWWRRVVGAIVCLSVSNVNDKPRQNNNSVSKRHPARKMVRQSVHTYHTLQVRHPSALGTARWLLLAVSVVVAAVVGAAIVCRHSFS